MGWDPRVVSSCVCVCARAVLHRQFYAIRYPTWNRLSSVSARFSPPGCFIPSSSSSSSIPGTLCGRPPSNPGHSQARIAHRRSRVHFLPICNRTMHVGMCDSAAVASVPRRFPHAPKTGSVRARQSRGYYRIFLSASCARQPGACAGSLTGAHVLTRSTHVRRAIRTAAYCVYTLHHSRASRARVQSVRAFSLSILSNARARAHARTHARVRACEVHENRYYYHTILPLLQRFCRAAACHEV